MVVWFAFPLQLWPVSSAKYCGKGGLSNWELSNLQLLSTFERSFGAGFIAAIAPDMGVDISGVGFRVAFVDGRKGQAAYEAGDPK
jgi:hypothetical protein